MCYHLNLKRLLFEAHKLYSLKKKIILKTKKIELYHVNKKYNHTSIGFLDNNIALLVSC